MKIITDEVYIFSLLEDYNQASFDPARIIVKHFSIEDGEAFFLFCPDGSCKGARLYITDSPPAPGEIENELLMEIMNMKGDAPLEDLRDAALELTRIFLENKNNSRLHFDAH